ncbi:MAG: 30S ribosomal protein S5 [Candidatus Omnitrophica bacterium]|nr:30S ribosomal protein S5 [Candidatus Omnitrophota bacterium]
MKDIKKIDEKELAVKTPAQAEQILAQEAESAVLPEEAVEATAASQPAAGPGAPAQGRGGRKRGGERKPFAKKPSSLTDSGLIEKVVSINRVSKTTKGGTRLAFSALVVVGDGKGKAGYGLGKAGEVATAIKKGLAAAKKQMIVIARRGTTITHEIIGQCGSAIVLLKPASEGTGVIASGAVRAVCDGAGISNILTKCHRSNNPINVVKATFDGLSRLKALRTASPLPTGNQETEKISHASSPIEKA